MALQAAVHGASADTYPSRPVHFIVPQAAASASDIVARLIGDFLSNRLGQQFVVDDRPGAGGNVGTEAVVHAAPDGYTLGLFDAPSAINATLYDKLNFNFIRDIAPVVPIVSFPYIMVVNPSFLPKRFPSSLPTPRPIPAKSIWRRPASAARRMSTASCSR